MGYEGSIGRKKFVDVRIVRSKTGLAILKGGTFYNWILHRNLRRLSKDVVEEINSINYQMKLLSRQSARRMKRSEKLVKTYDLPPLKPKQSDNSSSGNDSKKTINSNSSKHQESRKGNAHILSLRQDMRSTSPTDARDLRKIVYSPAPYKQRNIEDEENSGDLISLEIDQSNTYPHIKVEKYDEKLPPVNKSRRPSPPEYVQKRPERSASSNSLEVPSPVQNRKGKDGKTLTILTPNLNSNFSHSESSLLDVVPDDSYGNENKGANSIIKPLTITCGKTRSTARNQNTNQLTAKRTVSRSLSPRPRLTNRLQQTPTLIIKGSSNSN